MTRPSRKRTVLKLVVSLTVVVCLTSNPRAVDAQETPILKLSQTVELDEVGNADMRLDLTLPTNLYTVLKANTPNVAVLLRQLGAGRNWGVVEDVTGEFDDFSSTVKIRFRQRGMARMAEGDAWTVRFEKGAQLDLVDIHDNVAILNQTAAGPLGLVSAIIRVVVPKNSTQLEHHGPQGGLSYRHVPAIAENGRPEAKFAISHKEMLMSCLAKCYSNEGFHQLWVARSRFDNTGGQTLSDFRVRFRIAGYSHWSRWHRAGKVFPGQTVVDPFFPVFDLDKLNGLTGSRPAVLEVEFEYRLPNGERVSETDSRQLQILGRNETIFSGLAYPEVLTFEDRYEFLPAVLASFTTPNDPVIQQLAGRMSGRANGVGAAFTDKEAVAFLRALWDFMVENRIAYQSPPSYVNGARFGQHIKYGRDVLQNRAGTCIDLAILWASTCEAVGLGPVLVLVPGHCFPAVQLPSGQLLAIESTGIGKIEFEQAVEVGLKELAEARQGQSMLIDIRDWRKAGVQCLDLPNVGHNFLTDLGYRFDAGASDDQPVVQNAHHPPREEQVRPIPPEPDRRRPNLPEQFVGMWGFSGQDHTAAVQIGLVLQADGGFGYAMKVASANGQVQEFQDTGRWSVSGNQFVFETSQGVDHCNFEVRDGRLFIYFPKVNMTFGFVRMK